MSEKDHGAGLAAAENDTTVVPTSTASHVATATYHAREVVEAFRFDEAMALAVLLDEARLPWGLGIGCAQYHSDNRTVTFARIGIAPVDWWQEWQHANIGDWVMRRYGQCIVLPDDEFNRRYVRAEGRQS